MAPVARPFCWQTGDKMCLAQLGGREGVRDGRKAFCPDWQCWDPFGSLQVAHICNSCGAQMSVTLNTCWMGFAGYPGLQKHCRSVDTQKCHQDPSSRLFLVTENTGFLRLPCLILTTEREKLCTSVHAMLKRAAAAAKRLCVPRWSSRPS